MNKKGDNDLTVYIMTHNRPDMLLEVLQALEEQAFKRYNLIVSDNSDNQETRKKLENAGYLDKIEYVFRNNMVGHTNKILTEVETDYFMILHDDDIPMPEMIEKLYKKVKDSDYVAVACNAYVFWETTDKVFGKFIDIDEDMRVDSFEMAFSCYFEGIGAAPYPSYIYNKRKIPELHIKVEAGKYSDATWLSGLTRYGELYWIAEPLLFYRKHGNQESANADYEAKTLLLRYFKRNVKDPIVKKKIDSLLRRCISDKYKSRIIKSPYALRHLARRVSRFSKRFDCIYVYGCGDVGRRCVENLERHNIRVKGFLVTDNKDLSKSVMGYPVKNYDSKSIEEENAGIVVGVGGKLQNIIIPMLKEKTDDRRVLIYTKLDE